MCIPQLPPVVTDDTPGARFIFQADVWSQLELVPVQLKRRYRQAKDSPLLKLLDNLCSPPLTEDNVKLLQQLAQKAYEHHPFFGHTRAGAACKNSERLQQLTGPSFTYDAVDTGDGAALDKLLQVPVQVVVKVGARVMLLRNLDVENHWFNGTFGHVIGATDESVRMRTDEGAVRTLVPQTFKVVVGGQISTRKQVPLLLAWATTIHKSQGQGFERGSVDLDGCTQHGQVYTALSRFESIDGLSVKNFNKCRVVVDDAVRDFYADLFGQ